MARTSDAETRQQSLYLTIKRDLVNGVFPPGHRFRLTAMCDEYGASVSVLREALTRLSEQGLAELEPNKGFSVPVFSVDEVNDVAFLRIELETLMVRRSIHMGGTDWEVGVVAAHHQLAITPNPSADAGSEAKEAWTLAHRAFHEACASACGSPRLLSFRRQLYDQFEVIRQVAKLQHGGTRDVAREHRAIAEAVVSRQADLASRLIHDHIDLTRAACVARLTADTSDSTAPALVAR